ncbi:MAG TPA: hypothetical protein VFV81_09225, partial [Verrucomicrobiae bacterium]|nr:hypothetical protein [Verrucomicrobiae bacterium]
IDNPTSLNLEVDNGSLTGSGTLKQVTVLAGAEMNYTGNVNGSIVCAGTGTISGSVVGALTLQSGGVFTNRGTFNNSFATADGSLLVNEVGAKFNNFGTCTIVSNAVVINHGYLGDQASTAGQSITVDNGGTFEDTGEGWITMDGALTIASGGTFIPGGDGAGTTYIYKGSVTSGYPARVVMSQGSTNVFKVNKDLGQNTQLQADYVDYGGSAKVKSFNGGTLLFENIGTTPFAPGDTFTIARYSETGGAFTAFSGTATNTYPVMDPAAPGFGLAWNINGITTSGIVNITGVATDPTNLVFNVSQSGANLITQLSWPQDYTGWRLQEQQDTLAVGLGTNWVDVFGSQWTNSVTVTNSVNAGSGFFRMVYP